ncbi:unnamed protein product [Rotaria sp. Silwood2]|nr:unnamed protein product [Rotaria sp. Silwood2]CAF4340822.1 unnamed protein product [Rotaria sp. Silwood2]
MQNRLRDVVQEKILNELTQINERITSLLQLKQIDLLTTENEKQLNKHLRVKQKHKLRAFTQFHPDTGHVLQKIFRQDSGRPPVNDACPDLLSTVEEIATIGGASDDRRRTVTVRSCLTLDDLRETLKMQGYDIKRTTLYYW